MFLTEDKIKGRINELSGYRYRDSTPLQEWYFVEDEAGEIGEYPPENTCNSPKINIGERWEGRDLYVWMSAKAEIPAEWTGRKIVGLFDFGNTGGGNNSGFESLLFLNGKPYQGVDSNHKEVFLSGDQAGKTATLDFRLWTGLEGGGKPAIQEYKLQYAKIAWLDEAADNFYYNAKAVLESIMVLQDNQPERHMLLKALNQSMNLINWLNPGSEQFYESIHEAGDYLENELNSMEKSHAVTFHAVGHTHIDVAWLWRLKHTREKSARSFTTVMRLMEQYPEYLFLQSQPQLYEYIKEDYPEIYDEMKQRINDGRWEIEGGMWLEADCNIPSGESLVRQLLLGNNFMREEFNKESEYLWLPDVFGYSWALPQILRKSGIKTFMTTKISWSQFNRMPHDTFKWRGIDGSEILTHFITTTEPWPESRYYTYNGFMTPQVVKESWDAYKDKNINQDLLLSYGYGDGGGGVNREMLEMRRRIDKIPGLPHVKTSTAGDYFDKLHKNVDKTNEYVHTWDGELYLEFHRGTYTSQSFMKRMNRKLELLYRESEWLNVLSSAKQQDFTSYPYAELKSGWKTILRNQFHDIIPGSSIKEVYDDAKLEYEEARGQGNAAWNTAAESLVQKKDSYTWTVFNSAPWEREDLLFITGESDLDVGSWVDADGRSLNAQRCEAGWHVKVEKMPAMGYMTIQFKPAGTADEEMNSFRLNEDSVVTPFYDIKWNDKGQLTSIYDRENKREVLAEGSLGNVLQVFEDKPLMFDAWDIDIFYQQKMEEVTSLQSVELIENGSLQAVIRFGWKYEKSVISQDMMVYANSRRIDFKTKIDWHEQQRLLKAAFPVDIRSTEATYDIQYGNVKRPTHWNTSWDYARFESVGHQWADLSEGGYGVSLLNDCKYGYDIKDNVIRLSLLKSPIHPDPWADQGEHEFTYSLLPHAGSWVEGETVQEAWYLNNPLTYTEGSAAADKLSMLHMNASNIMIDAVKKAEYGDKAVVRVHEFEGKRTNAEIGSDFTIKSWQECDLMERPETDEVYENSIAFTLKPYEIKTFLVEFSN
ncbi:alpha-mannosidase [Virgibacillus profundi]|uniref:Alpha-mannosidase n=1 Tax=Virgibacillus profundi TaxID=2024555 RepID=A0A2A2II42_9BACI|nr:alpha-mannosidase [Virgibacillus profundi]PAV31671.1 alpha-mannosidase [Virgibacillus profundi]PXY55858.1 alpha-mannosidase [Virgibacillus profundi]